MYLLVNGLSLVFHSLFLPTGLAKAVQIRPEDDRIVRLVRESGFTQSLNNDDPCSLFKIKADFNACPYAKDLADQVKAQGPVKVHCTTEEDIVPTGAVSFIDKREIFISAANEIKLVTLLFEMNNLNNANEQFAIHHNKCTLGLTNYVSLIERSEYNALRDTYKIVDQCVRGKYWGIEHLDFMKENDGTLQEYLQRQEESGHTDQYRIIWYKDCTPERLSKWKKANLGVKRNEL